MINRAHLILYVADQAASTEFYSKMLNIEPRLNVLGMTEFEIGPSIALGLMPIANASRLLNQPVYDGSDPKAELYLIVDKPDCYHDRALHAGAREISPLEPRDWGHNAAYSIDADGNIIAFAEVSD